MNDYPDLTPRIRWDLRPSYHELITPVDDTDDARVWRELALAAVAQLHRLTVSHTELQRRLRAALQELRRRRPA